MLQLLNSHSILELRFAPNSPTTTVLRFPNHEVQVFVTATSEEHKKKLIGVLGLSPSKVLLNGAELGGFDVILSSGETATSSEAWAKIAPTGKFIHLGVKKGQEAESVFSQPFARGASYSSFEFLEWQNRRPKQAKE